METKYVRVPFEVELAKKITDNHVKGRILRNFDNANVRIVCFDQKYEGDYILSCLVSQKCGEGYSAYKQNGKNLSDDKSDYDLMLEIPEYMTFKDGDIITCFGAYKWIFIYKKSGYITGCYVALDDTENMLDFTEDSHVLEDEEIKSIRFSTEAERQKLIDTLKASKEPEAKECLKILGIDSKPECEFKTGQPVIGIAGNGEWRYDLFSHYKPEYRNGNYVCSARSYSKCLPYNEQTAHLVGTKENPK